MRRSRGSPVRPVARRVTIGLRRSGGRVAVITILLLTAISCERGERATDAADRRSAMTETEYVNTMAALTVALEEGRIGEDASARIVALGATPYTREEIEAFVAPLRSDPERWAGVNLKVDKRIGELKAKGRPPR
jgi:hypothetical protein